MSGENTRQHSQLEPMYSSAPLKHLALNVNIASPISSLGVNAEQKLNQYPISRAESSLKDYFYRNCQASGRSPLVITQVDLVKSDAIAGLQTGGKVKRDFTTCQVLRAATVQLRPEQQTAWQSVAARNS